MYPLLIYIMCLTSLILTALFIYYYKRNITHEKLLLLSEVLQNHELYLARFKQNLNLVFLDAASEPEFFRLADAKDPESRFIIFYNAPEYRIKLFERKTSTNMKLCKDENQVLEQMLDVKTYPCLIKVNYFKKKLGKIHEGVVS